jgi:hypothetical protein
MLGSEPLTLASQPARWTNTQCVSPLFLQPNLASDIQRGQLCSEMSIDRLEAVLSPLRDPQAQEELKPDRFFQTCHAFRTTGINDLTEKSDFDEANAPSSAFAYIMHRQLYTIKG